VSECNAREDKIDLRSHLRRKLRGTWLHSALHELQRIKLHVFRRSHGKRLLLEQYERATGKSLNMNNPQCFSEKLYKRMITWIDGHDPIYTQLTDKYTVRDYVSHKIGKEYLIKLLWHGKYASDIPFDTLPSEYIVKPNHSSGQVILVDGYPDRVEIMSRASAWLRANYYWGSGECQYFNIPPRILIEEYLKTRNRTRPLDYKFWCFDGIPEVIHVDNYERDINPFFDAQWKLLDLSYRADSSRPAIKRPRNYEEMISLASQLSAGFDFVRVDLYNIDGKIYFGELTFTPAGSLKLQPAIWDAKLGEKWKMSSAA
jgi:hypothetical protein